MPGNVKQLYGTINIKRLFYPLSLRHFSNAIDSHLSTALRGSSSEKNARRALSIATGGVGVGCVDTLTALSAS
jgi:hypothetical protein